MIPSFCIVLIRERKPLLASREVVLSACPGWPCFNYKNITFCLLVNLFPRVLRGLVGSLPIKYHPNKY